MSLIYLTSQTEGLSGLISRQQLGYRVNGYVRVIESCFKTPQTDLHVEIPHGFPTFCDMICL